MLGSAVLGRGVAAARACHAVAKRVGWPWMGFGYVWDVQDFVAKCYDSQGASLALAVCR